MAAGNKLPQSSFLANYMHGLGCSRALARRASHKLIQGFEYALYRLFLDLF